ncbi:chemotaxis protein MotB [Clostridium moniliforme]|uniref:Chemotaxis protein MotB n=1 Tax=Clostridium moniliforme TaxID=39489 RepID=A0ABS4F1D3_9CLOT|nr:OmpA family protein [Clostridium moniliforme]MBP1890061.1 chemotaxis protein MotB [Clostridium moniliforme]
MLRKKRKTDDVNSNGWMDTYADTITLLLTFFILLYSFSTTDNKKLRLIAAAFENTMLGKSTNQATGGGNAEAAIKTEYENLVDKVNEIIKKNDLEKVIKVREEDSGVVLQLSDSILFDSGRAELKKDSTKILDVISNIIPKITNEISVQGHTDNVPIHNSKYDSNWELSTARAVTVLQYFIEVKKISPKRFSANGYGEYRPLVANSNAKNRAVNRRVDIVIMQQRNVKKVSANELQK